MRGTSWVLRSQNPAQKLPGVMTSRLEWPRLLTLSTNGEPAPGMLFGSQALEVLLRKLFAGSLRGTFPQQLKCPEFEL